MRDEIDEYLIVATAELTAARQTLAQSIRSYPTPISGCDAQFNHLLAQRKKVDRALAALAAEPFVPTPRHPDPRERIESR
ncbi:hypothetical protein AADZ90_013470 [Aestuariibius sp. 2305UL40-4]|uniref:hypothetical protein n=1 Tax=Aestuariibius violaceus TaxID=3234132 RepID=UPI00345E54B5